jgi:hypothetical protein
MSFSTRTIVHTFLNPDGSDGTGSVEFTLTKRMTNSGTSLLPASVTSTLSPQGGLSQVLTANNDAGTTPADAQWRVDIRLASDSLETYYITVPTGTGNVDLGTLLPDQPNAG